MKILLPAREIPLGEIVTKKTGAKKYVIRDRITVYSVTGVQQVIKADSGSRFLIRDTGDATTVSGDAELMWDAADCEVVAFIETKSAEDK